MRNVVIVGGGLSGLAAAYELEKRGISYTLIEVKRRLGGSLQSVQLNGFWVDMGAMAISHVPSESDLNALGLSDALYPLNDTTWSFKAGTQMLVDALAHHITAPRLMRMAVSSIGELADKPQRYAICLENGIVFDAGAIILAVPARYAERMFYGYQDAISERLRGYRYDKVLRVTLGFRRDELTVLPRLRPDVNHIFLHSTDYPSRVPIGCVLVQIGIRGAQFAVDTAELVEHLREDLRIAAQPILQRVDYWSEADPLSCYDDEHAARMEFIYHQLPRGIALIGNDYSLQRPMINGTLNIAARMEQAQAAVRRVLDLDQ